MFRSIGTRIAGVAIAIALVAIVSVAWIVNRITADAAQSTVDNNRVSEEAIVSGLSFFARNHENWDNVDAYVDDLSQRYEMRIALAVEGAVIADTDEGSPLPQSPRLLDVSDPLGPGPGPFEQVIGRVGADPAVVARLGECFNEANVPFVVAPAAVNDDGTSIDIPVELLTPDGGFAETVGICMSEAGLPRFEEDDPTLGIDVFNDADGTDFGGGDFGDSDVDGSDFGDGGLNDVDGVFGEVDLTASAFAPAASLYLGSNEVGFLDDGVDARFLGVVLAVLGAAAAASWLAAQRMLRPITELTQAAERMAGGRLDTRVEASSNDELGALGNSFNTMAGSLEGAALQRRQLTSDVAHELRNPLANIKGYIEGAQDGLVDLDTDLLDSLHEDTVHLQRLIEDLHQVSLADTATLPLDFGDIDLGELATGSIASHQLAATRAGVELVVTAPPTAVVTGDERRLRQALDNLVSNAIRHTTDGGRVEIAIAPGPDSATTVEVRDTGEGIAPEHLPHLFDRFYRVDSSRTRATGGTGLGLAVTRAIVEAHGGQVAVASQPDHGTTFRLLLPPPHPDHPDRN